MSTSARRIVILNLYKQLLRESQKFSNYNYRSYALRRIRDGFKEAKSETDADKINEAQRFAEENLEIIKRSVIMDNLYKSPRTAVEK